MNALGLGEVGARAFDPKAQIRELTPEEVNEVAGGALPVVIIAVVVVANAAQEIGEESSEQGEGEGGAEGGDDWCSTGRDTAAVVRPPLV